MRNYKPILLIEDERVDAMTIERALKELKVANPLVHVLDGEKGLAHLRNKENEKPCLILLDLSMPKMDGIEFLKCVKSDDVLREIPVVVLTTSNYGGDIVESFESGIAGYMVKGADYKKLVEIIKTVNLYWTLSELPNVR